MTQNWPIKKIKKKGRYWDKWKEGREEKKRRKKRRQEWKKSRSINYVKKNWICSHFFTYLIFIFTFIFILFYFILFYFYNSFLWREPKVWKKWQKSFLKKHQMLHLWHSLIVANDVVSLHHILNLLLMVMTPWNLITSLLLF